MVGLGCGDVAFGSVVCFFAGVRELGCGVYAAALVVGERMESEEMAS